MAKIYQVFNLDVKKLNDAKEQKKIDQTLGADKDISQAGPNHRLKILIEHLKAKNYGVLTTLNMDYGLPSSLIVFTDLIKISCLKDDFFNLAQQFAVKFYSSGEFYFEA